MISRDLLWEAYPDGFVACQGLTTVSGWMFIRPNPNGISWTLQSPHDCDEVIYPDRIKHHNKTGEKINCWSKPAGEALANGDLLPNVDKSDVATWACLLEDLAQAVGYEGATHLTWRKLYNNPWGSNTPKGWVLTTSKGPYGFDLSISLGPEEALVRARIKIREETGR